ncbi:MAG: GNAT family N-acetyltransferase [Alphaproteobacteria bacterium]|nr:GNAT family N-acetyltransferase [Alphaproteobacteria bacterium]
MRERWVPDAPALTVEPPLHGGGPELAVSYGELGRRVRRATGWCRDQGLVAGDVLALQLPKDPAFLELHLGALAAGVVTLPLHPDATPGEVELLMEDAGAKVLVRDVAAVRPALDASPEVDPADVPWDAVAVLLYTSGTTGRPKGAPLTHGNLVAGVRSLHDAWRWTPADVLLHALPLFHVHGLFVAQYGALWAGAHTRWLAAFDPVRVLELLPRSTVFMGVPTFYSRLLAHGRHGADLGSMRLFTSGSAPLPSAHHEAFQREFGHTILERYGMTEIGIVLANPYDGERRPGTVGVPLAHVEAKVVGADGATLAPDEVGEICIRGPSVFGGYLGRPEATAEALQDGWMHTGDLGSVSTDGWFRVVGRAKDLVISGGLNVYPREVEAKLLKLEGVREVAVFGVPDEDLGERVAAAVVCDGPWEPQRLQATLREQVAPYKLPRRWFRVDDLPRNTMGKVGKAELRRRYGVRVRPATLDDLEGIVRRNLALCDETEDFALDPGVVRSGVARVFAEDVGASYWIAERDGRIAGQLMVTTEWSDWRDRPVWWIQSVYVEPDDRRYGVYRALHDHVLGRARQAGAAGVRLYVETRNERAQRTYRAVGMDGGHYAVFETMFAGGGS